MEENDDLMSIFSNGMELNYDGFENVEEQEEEDLNIENNNEPVEEEVPEKVDGPEDDDSEENDPGDESSPNLYSSLAGVLFEQGIIPSLESSDKILTPDDLVGVVKQEIDIQAQNRFNEYLENLDVSKIAESRRNVMELDSIDEDYLRDNIELAKELIYRDALNQGLSEDRARKILKKTVDLGEDTIIEDALESRESLKEYERRQEETEKARYEQSMKDARQEQELIDKTIKSYIFDSPEIVKGIPNTKAMQNAVYKSMTEIVSKNPNTGELENKLMKERSVDPIKFDARMYYFYELTNGFTDLGKFQATVTSKATKNLEKALRKTSFEGDGKTPDFMSDPNSYNGSFGSELVL